MIILASTSPRRIEILKKIVSDFTTLSPLCDEREIDDDDCSLLCLKEAHLKAKSIASTASDAFIIASDTMVLFQNEKLGKPEDEKSAFSMLKQLQGNTHQVYTAYVIYHGLTLLKERIVEADVFIEKMSDEEINKYIETKSPLDKAGAYGIQDKDYIHAKILKGDIYTVMGLPKEDLEHDLKELKII